MDIRKKVMDIIKKELELEGDITDDAKLDELGADTPGMLEIALAIEEELGIEVPDKDHARLRTVADVISFVTARMQT